MAAHHDLREKSAGEDDGNAQRGSGAPMNERQRGRP
jgi:hypothetical protein